MEYICHYGNTVHVIRLKKSENRKLGKSNTLHTYHFTKMQVETGILSHDSEVCMDCPKSYNQNGGKSGGCYTHKGLQMLGLLSILRRLKTLEIPPYTDYSFKDFIRVINRSHQIDLTRLGVYGEPVSFPGLKHLLSKPHIGYTRQWIKHPELAGKIMASCFSSVEAAHANSLGFKAFVSVPSLPSGVAVCPASKEFKGKKLTCDKCKACNGLNNNIYIKTH